MTPPSPPPSSPIPETPDQQPIKKTPFFKKHIAWIVAGVFAAICIGMFIYAEGCQEEEPINLDFDWDKKYQNDPNRFR